MNASSLLRQMSVAATCLAIACQGEQTPEGLANPLAQEEGATGRAHNPAPGLVSEAQLNAGREYRIDDRFAIMSARNPAAGLALRFFEEHVEVETTDARVTLQVARIGRHSAAGPLADAERAASANRIDYERGVVDEWYLNGPLGLQQGLTLQERPGGEGLLEVEVSVGGDLRPVLVGTDIELHDASGAARLFYGGLAVVDAEGTRVGSALASVGDSIWIRVADADAVYPLVIDPVVVTELASLTGAAALDEFGGTPAPTSGGPSVAIDGSTALVAATYSGGRAGSVQAFVDNAGSWEVQAELPRPAALSANARFGYSIAIDGDTAVVSAPLPLADAGQVFVFSRSGVTWTLDATLTGAAGDNFGSAVAISGDTIVVGARYSGTGGLAFVYRGSGATWTLEQTISGADTGPRDDFGSSVDIDGDTLVVGSVFHPMSSGRGAAYVFTRVGTTWSEDVKLVGGGGAPLDLYSRSLHLEGGLLAVGAPQANGTEGAAYVYRGAGALWSEEAVVAGAPSARDQFGYSVAVQAGFLAVGARFGDSAASDAGSVHLFRASGNTFVDETIYTRTGAAADERFGDSVALDGSTLVVGAPFAGMRAGAASILGLCDGCQIDGACHADGALNPANTCLRCDVASDTGAWTTLADAAACDDGMFCTVGDACSAGTCIASPRDCLDVLACTTDTCNEAMDQCDHTINDGCLIAGVCVTTAELDPSNACLSCDPTTSTTDYSALPDDTRCGDPVCAAAQLTTAPTCVTGVCNPGTTSACPGGGMCLNATMCVAECTDDDMCPADSYCDTGGTDLCVPTLEVGMMCGRNAMCAGSQCVDGVCCDGACGGTCESCALAGSAGTCTAVPVDMDPDDECALSCDGARMCQAPVDAGVDAGGDAGDDAGLDAGPEDAGLGDAAAADGATVDAGTSADAGGGVTGGSCGCVVGESRNTRTGWFVVLLLGALWRRRRVA